MPIALLTLAALLILNVVLGPLGVGIIRWRVSPNSLNQTLGADGAMLILAVPVALLAAYYWWREHRLAPPLALGAGLAALYYGVAETLGGDYLRYEGNNERFFLLFLAVIVLGWTTAVRAWAELDPSPPLPKQWVRQGFAFVLLAVSAVLGAAWLKQLLDIALTGVAGQEYTESPGAFWTIRLVDLGFIVPIALWTAVGLWQKSSAALKAAYGLASFLTLQGVAVLAMGLVMLAREDPTASTALVFTLAPIVLALTGLTVALLRPYARVHGSRQRELHHA